MFELETSLIFWSTVSFAILLALLYKIALPPLMQIMEERKDQIASDLSTAQTSKDTAQQLVISRQKSLEEALQKGEKIITDSTLNAEVQKKEILAKAESTASKVIAQAQNKIETEEEKAKQELKDSIATFVAEASSKLIGKTLTEKEQFKLIDESLKELKNKL
ncbi:MAG: F0F1 ATP synthase subunit B [Candidatus Margulisbacteria bacterium]|nr:F0F1 ATP synthase subunit B [Candidatus Margulisiibacteriota bacterium]MBU1022238.1 F0F1 ATP synthase subunit B [Candidatus Margulisiibacteriota bacterium]MBU1729323.1 F0F1 ATP synthase subunit B [Candidatus Margulisiibacteriota bacterium]MBU1955596.1 F0F1 ATP synthase subunit B [Candidatus Margulisiibacteriota bacterium]